MQNIDRNDIHPSILSANASRHFAACVLIVLDSCLSQTSIAKLINSFGSSTASISSFSDVVRSMSKMSQMILALTLAKKSENIRDRVQIIIFSRR